MREKMMLKLLLLLLPAILFATLPPSFSHKSGFYEDSFLLTITHTDPNATIYYTLDGSNPDPANLDGKSFEYKNSYSSPPFGKSEDKFEHFIYKTLTYKEPILIEDLRYSPDRISQVSTTISFPNPPEYLPKPKLKDSLSNRLKSIYNDLANEVNLLINRGIKNVIKFIYSAKTKVGNREFLPLLDLEYEEPREYAKKGVVLKAMALGDDGVASQVVAKSYFVGFEKYDLPAVSLIVDPQELFNYDDGVLVAGRAYDEWVEAGKKDKKLRGGNAGANWDSKREIQAVVELFDKAEYREFEANISPHGGSSREYAQKSLKLKLADKKRSIKVFDDGVEVNRFMLRNAGNHNYKTFLADGVMHRAFADLSFGTQRYKPFVVFINGEYNGILNARDRRDSAYIRDLYALPSKKIDEIKKNRIADKGDLVQFNKLVRTIESKKDDSYYDRVATLMDLGSFYDYFAVEIFLANSDWADNNMAVWRYRGKNAKEGSFADGRWRWFLYDTDRLAHAFRAGFMEYDILKDRLNADSVATKMFQNLMSDDRIREEFLTRFFDLLNTHFMPDRLSAFVKEARDHIASEMPRQIERWGSPESMSEWSSYVDKLLEFVEHRRERQFEQLQKHFKLSSYYDLDIEIPEGASIGVNTLQLNGSSWSGIYTTDLPIKLKASIDDGYEFVAWSGVSEDLAHSKEIVLSPSSDIKVGLVVKKITH